jgi:myo-inositol catabolism protein IolC
VTSAVSGKTNYLIVGARLEDGREVSTGSKYVKAKSVGTTIFTEDEFEEFLRKKLDNPNFSLENYRDWRNKEGKKSPVKSQP